MTPVLCGEVVEREQFGAVFLQTRGGIEDTSPRTCPETGQRPCPLRSLPGVVQHTLRPRLEAFRKFVQNIGRLVNGTALHQQDAGNTPRKAFQKPRAPSPIASCGGCSRLLDFRFNRTSFHDNSPFRTPSTTATSSLVSSAVAPTSTGSHGLGDVD